MVLPLLVCQKLRLKAFAHQVQTFRTYHLIKMVAQKPCRVRCVLLFYNCENSQYETNSLIKQ